jgi:hypothetical protein
VTVAGLLAGEDLAAAVKDSADRDVVLVPAEALNQDDLFVDSYSLERLKRELAPARVVAGYELTETIRTL